MRIINVGPLTKLLLIFGHHCSLRWWTNPPSRKQCLYVYALNVTFHRRETVSSGLDGRHIKSRLKRIILITQGHVFRLLKPNSTIPNSNYYQNICSATVIVVLTSNTFCNIFDHSFALILIICVKEQASRSVP